MADWTPPEARRLVSPDAVQHREVLASILRQYRTLSRGTAYAMTDAMLRYLADPVGWDTAAEFTRATDHRNRSMGKARQ